MKKTALVVLLLASSLSLSFADSKKVSGIVSIPDGLKAPIVAVLVSGGEKTNLLAPGAMASKVTSLENKSVMVTGTTSVQGLTVVEISEGITSQKDIVTPMQSEMNTSQVFPGTNPGETNPPRMIATFLEAKTGKATVVVVEHKGTIVVPTGLVAPVIAVLQGSTGTKKNLVATGDIAKKIIGLQGKVVRLSGNGTDEQFNVTGVNEETGLLTVPTDLP